MPQGHEDQGGILAAFVGWAVPTTR